MTPGGDAICKNNYRRLNKGKLQLGQTSWHLMDLVLSFPYIYSPVTLMGDFIETNACDQQFMSVNVETSVFV